MGCYKKSRLHERFFFLQLLNKLCHTANPSMLSVPGFIAFVNAWLSKNRNLSEIDSNSGIVPEDWIQEIKAAVTNIYGDLEGESLT